MIPPTSVPRWCLLTLLVVCLPPSVVADESDSGRWSGFVAAEARWFPKSPLHAGQESGTDLSLVSQVEYHRQWDDGRQRLVMELFGRFDEVDDKRTHADVAELYWHWVERRYELRVGISKLFWGVTESQHLVDVINQTDQVEDSDGEDKLGQPMIRLSLFPRWGDLDLLLLTGFRERTFPGSPGRLRGPLPVAKDEVLYASSRGDDHVDWALRWSRAIGPFDLGLSYFEGTARDPDLLPTNGSSGPSLVPFYNQTRQIGLEFQATLGSWLWKMEAVHRDPRSARLPTGNHRLAQIDGSPYTAVTAGFEVTLYGLAGSSSDLGWLLEYLWDERDASVAAFSDDVLVGARWVGNDTAGSEVLIGAVIDRHHHGQFFTLEAERRIAESWKVQLQARVFSRLDPQDPLFFLRADDFIQLSWARYF